MMMKITKDIVARITKYVASYLGLVIW